MSAPATMPPALLAADLAREAHEQNFSSHRGAEAIEGTRRIYLYDNHRYRTPGRREAEHEELHRVLHLNGINVVATASYPTSGESAGYTIATIFEAADDDVEGALDLLRTEWEHIVLRGIDSADAKRRLN